MNSTLRIVAVAASLLFASLGASAQTLAPSGDAHVRGGSAANNNYGGVVLLGVRTANNALNTYWSYLKFDTSAVSGQVISARLRLFTALSSNGSVQTNLHAAPATWGETTITWNNKPALGAQLGSFTVANTGYVWFELDVTAHVQAELAQGAVGFALVNPAVSSQLVAVQSRESSNPAQLVLTLNAAPTVSLTAPPSGAVFTAPANITVSADAADADGTVSQVQFFANGASIGVDASAPYGIEWANPAAGSYSLTAVATDDLGATTTSAAVPIVVNAPPTVSLSSPTQNATFTAPANITLTAQAADTDGTVTSVEFYHGTTLITTLTAAPYTFAWTNVSQGAYVLTAKATDDRGATTTSAPVNITVGAAVGQLYFIHADHLNTPRLVADATGTTVWRWDQQEPFGNNPADENPSGLGAFDLPLRLPGQRYDAETGLHYNYFRDYDPSLGRYGESDPIGLAGGTNTYVYVSAAALRFSDKFGLESDQSCPCPKSKMSDEQCCSHPKAVSEYNDRTFGIVMCCLGRKVACVSPVGGPEPGRSIIAKCLVEHEKTHFADVVCKGCDTIYRPSFAPGRDPNAGECTAYGAEISCLKNAGATCGNDAVCLDWMRRQVEKRTQERRGFPGCRP